MEIAMYALRLRRAMWMSLALAVSTAPSAAPPAGAPASTRTIPGTILFSRSRLNPDTTLRNSSLWLTNGTTTRALTLPVDGVRYSAASWSPNGTRIVFVRGRIAARPDNRDDIYVIDPDCGRPRRLTSGVGSFDSPVWGPRNEIAFVSRYGDHQCLSLVDAAGLNKRDLFCPTNPSEAPTQVLRPIWSADGSSLYVATGYSVSRLDPTWRLLAYRVNAATGATVLLADGILDAPQELEFAPDGRNALFNSNGEIMRIDLTRNTATSIGNGYSPRWSKDGRRIAFTGEVFEGGPEFRYYQPLYVMNADGSNVRRVTRSRVDNHAYFAADWSDDGVHLLVNRRIYLDPSLTIPREALRIINVDTLEVTALPQGSAAAGAWFER